MLRGENFRLKKVETLDGNVGYFKFDNFVEPEFSKAAFTGAMDFLHNTSAVVIDLTDNGGGSSEADYVIHNLASPGWRDVLFAYNVDLVRGEGGQTTWYEGFEPLQRRYVRIVPSALTAIEYRLFGSRAAALKSVSLVIHLLTLVLAYRLLRRHLTDPRTAAPIVALVGLHPSAAECVGWFACQPLLVAGLASLLAAHALLKLREQVTVGRRLPFVAAAVAALFSYEAAVPSARGHRVGDALGTDEGSPRTSR